MPDTSNDKTASSDGLPFPRRLKAIVALSFGTALVVVDGAVATVALPTVARDLGVAESSAVFVVTIYQLVLVTTLLPLSALGDRLGHRRLYQYGQTLFLCASILCLFVDSLAMLIVVRAAQSVGAAAALSVSSALIRSIYPASQLGRGLSVNIVVVSVGNGLAPALGGLVLTVAPWPWLFASAAPLAIASLLLGRSLPDPEGHQHRFDVRGAVLFAVTMGLGVSALNTAAQLGWTPLPFAMLTTGIVIGVFFVRRELGEERPIVPVDLLARPLFALSVIGSLAAFVGSMIVLTSLPFRLEQSFGLAPLDVGSMIAVWALANLLVAPLAGTLSDRYPAGALGGIGMAIAVIGLIYLAYLPATADQSAIAWRMFVCGTGFALFLSSNVRLIVGSAPAERAASAGGLVATARLTGQTLGATVVAVLLAAGLGGGRLPGLLAAALAMVAGICSVARLTGRVRRS